MGAIKTLSSRGDCEIFLLVVFMSKKRVLFCFAKIVQTVLLFILQLLVIKNDEFVGCNLLYIFFFCCLDDGLNEVKLKNYGQNFIDCVNQYYATNPDIQSIKSEKPTLSSFSETSDNSSGMSKNNSNINTSVVSLKQFVFVEKSKISSQSSEGSTSQHNEPVDFDDKSNSDISDTQFNEIMDFLENDPDETICEANNSNNDFHISSSRNNKKATNEPSALMNENSLELNPKLLELCDSENTEKSTNNSQDKKRRLSNTDEENELVPKKPTKIMSKYLDF